MQSKTRWLVENQQNVNVDNLTKELGVSPLVARLLVNRGITTAEAAQLFLHQDEEHFYHPFLLDSMDTAIERIEFAIKNHEKILVFGDYDAGATRS